MCVECVAHSIDGHSESGSANHRVCTVCAAYSAIHSESGSSGLARVAEAERRGGLRQVADAKGLTVSPSLPLTTRSRVGPRDNQGWVMKTRPGVRGDDTCDDVVFSRYSTVRDVRGRSGHPRSARVVDPV